MRIRLARKIVKHRYRSMESIRVEVERIVTAAFMEI